MVERETAWKANNEEEDTSSTTDMDGRVSKGIVGMLVRYPLNHHVVLNDMHGMYNTYVGEYTVPLLSDIRCVRISDQRAKIIILFLKNVFFFLLLFSYELTPPERSCILNPAAREGTRLFHSLRWQQIMEKIQNNIIIDSQNKN